MVSAGSLLVSQMVNDYQIRDFQSEKGLSGLEWGNPTHPLGG